MPDRRRGECHVTPSNLVGAALPASDRLGVQLVNRRPVDLAPQAPDYGLPHSQAPVAPFLFLQGPSENPAGLAQLRGAVLANTNGARREGMV